jgi:hypothetical protein
VLLAAAGLLWAADRFDARPASDDGAAGSVAAEPPDGLLAAGAPPPAGFATLPAPAGRDEPWNWVTYVHSNLWTAAGTQYAVWTDPDGAPLVGSRPDPAADGAVGETAWETFDLSAVAGNPLAAPTVADAHRVYAIAVDAHGYVHVAGNMHSSGLRYVRSARPHRIDAWVDAGMVGADEDAITYPTFVTAGDGSLLFFYRDGGSDGADLILNTLPADAAIGDGGGWDRVGVVLAGRDVGAAPYPQHITVDERGRIHLLHVWRVGPGAASNRYISYVASDDDGASWRTVDGQPLSAPVGVDPAAVAVTIPEDVVVVNQGGAAVDGDGNPYGAFRVREPDGAPRPLWLVGHDGTSWQVEPVAGTGSSSGRATLLSDAGRLLLVWPTNGPERSTTVMVTDVTDVGTARSRALLHAPVADFEPVHDRQAASDGLLRLLVPVPGDGQPAAVLTYDLDRLGRRRRHARDPAGLSAQRCRSSASSRPVPSSTSPASAMNTARCSASQVSQGSVGRSSPEA